MRRQYLYALFAASVLLLCGCSAHHFAKPDLLGKKFAPPVSGRMATEAGQTPGEQTAAVKPMNDARKLGRLIGDPISCTKIRVASVPRIIPLGENGNIVVVKRGREGEDGLAIGVRVGNFIIAFPVFDPCAGFAPPAGPMIIYGGLPEGPTYLPNQPAPAVKNKKVVL